ncbi:MAG: hypothetical protein J7463_10700 [Roseiflexus sp.]|nr:hypothetical protein [Roseiflexus sp.]MBO9381121.1 hypothetical protein [Roseiflexus sp.]
MSTARLVHALGPPLAYLVLAVVFTWPLSAHLTTATGGGLDPLLQTWVLAWDAHALITDPRTVWHAPIFFPYPETLAYSDHHLLLAMMTLPLIITGGPVLAYNLLVLTSYSLTGWAVYLLARDMLARMDDTRMRIVSAFAAGALFAFGTYRMTHVVHLQLLQTAWLPLALLFLRRLLCDSETGNRRWRNAALFGLFAGIQCATALYYAYFAALALGLSITVRLRDVLNYQRQPDFWQRIGGLALGGALAVLIAAPVTLPYIRVYEYLGVVRSLRELDNWSAPLQAYLAVVPTNWLYGGRGAWFAASGGEFALFPGFVTAVLAVASLALAVWERIGNKKSALSALIGASDAIFLAVLAFCAWVLSLGVGIRLERGGEMLPIPMPYATLYERIPGFGALRVPARWAMLTHLALALLASFALVRVGQWLRSMVNYRLALIIPAVIGTVALVEHASFPLPLATIPTPKPVYAWLGTQRDMRALLELPVGPVPRGAELERITERQFHQIHHWKPLAAGYSGVIPFGTTDLLRRVQRLPDDDTLRYLALIGIDTLVIHCDEYDPETLTRLLAWADATPLLNRRAKVGDALVYAIDPQADPSSPVMSGASIFVSSDERVPGMLALGLIRRWEAEGAHLYGFERTRYYPTLRLPQPGQVFDYGLLAADEDPLIYGFDTEGVRWRSNGLALYARDPRLRTAIDLAQPVAGQFHPMYPAALTLTIETDRIHIHDKVFTLHAPLTAAAVELDIASLVTQTLMIDGKAYTVPPGAVTVAASAPINRTTAIIGQADRLSIQRLRVLSAPRAPAPPPEGSLAITADCRFDGTRLLVTARIGGAGALALDVRGASARDDKPIHLLEGIPPAIMPSDGEITFSVDLLDPTEPWLTHRGKAEDGRYIVYLKSAGRSRAPVAPIATFSIRNGVISDAQPAPLPLHALR